MNRPREFSANYRSPLFFAVVLIFIQPLPSAATALDPELRQHFTRALQHPLGETEEDRPFSLVIRGGISLGVYEAGVNWALLRLMKDLHDDRSAENKINPQLVAAAGASAGAINGFLAGLLWCSDTSKTGKPLDTMDNNVIRNSWQSTDINKLILHEPGELPEDKAAFSRELLRTIQDNVVEAIRERTFRDNCEVAFGLSLTRSQPVLTNNAGVDVRQQRLVLPMLIKGSRSSIDGYTLQNLKLDAPEFSNPTPQQLRDRPFLSSVVYLDSGTQKSAFDPNVKIEDVFEAITASSSFPVAFAPTKLSYCIFQPESLRSSISRGAQGNRGKKLDGRCPPEYRRLSSFFVDGGVFDNDPLELARHLSEFQQGELAAQTIPVQYIKVDPDKRRPPTNLFRFQLPEYGQPGDSVEISLWAGGPGNSTNDINIHTAKVRHCIAQLDSDGNVIEWQRASKDEDIPLTEAAVNSRFFIGSVHTRPDIGPKSVYLNDVDINVKAKDRLLLYSPEEDFRPSCKLAEKADERNKTKRRTIGILSSDPPGLSTQLGFVGGSISSARGYRLYDELMRNNWHDGAYDVGNVRANIGNGNDNPNSSRPLFQPARLTPLVGDFLLAFGAFVDERFRYFDYHAGIYDAVYGISEFLCVSERAADSNRNQCRAERAEQIYLHLCAPGDTDKIAKCRSEFPNANAVIYQMIVLEICGIEKAKEIFEQFCDVGPWSWIYSLIPEPAANSWDDDSRELLRIGAALIESNDAVEHTDNDPFVRFIKTLADHRNDLQYRDSELFNRMLARSDRQVSTWYYPIAREVIPQLLDLEDEDKGIRDTIGSEPAGSRGLIKAGLALSGLVSESIMEEPTGWQWDQTSVPESANRRWVASVLFSELAVDSRNGGAALYWNRGYRFENQWAIDFRIGPYLRQRFGNETIEFSEATAFVTRRLKNPLFSSVGIGPTFTRTWSNDNFGSNETVGASASLGLLADKLRITYGVRSFSREEFAGDSIYWHIGVNDLPGIFYWICRGVDKAPKAISWICDAH